LKTVQIRVDILSIHERLVLILRFRISCVCILTLSAARHALFSPAHMCVMRMRTRVYTESTTVDMADLSLDEVIRRRSFNARGVSKR